MSKTKQAKRIILDTNIYGWILKKKEEEILVDELLNKKDILVYGNDIIRKELRDVPKKIKLGDKNFRIMILNLYDRIIKDHSFVTTNFIKKVAGNYFETFKEISRIPSRPKMINDFLIVACASVHNLDIVVSEDEKTLSSKDSLTTYRIVNNLRGFNMPEFINYKKFRRLLT